MSDMFEDNSVVPTGLDVADCDIPGTACRAIITASLWDAYR
jgi:hypothetical protein